MDKFTFVRDGVTRLPPGFRFQPTDEELVFHYLKCKVFSFPLPAPIIHDINVYKYEPWDLPGNSEQERYFFCNKEAKYPNGNRINQATASGYWKATGLDKQILSSSRINQMVGMKKTLVFYIGNPPHESRTDWIMHEYCLVSTADTQTNSKEMENWVICRIFFKKRSMKDYANIDKIDLCVATSSCSSTSSYITGISEVSSNGSESESEYDVEESSSSSSNFF